MFRFLFNPNGRLRRAIYGLTGLVYFGILNLFLGAYVWSTYAMGAGWWMRSLSGMIHEPQATVGLALGALHWSILGFAAVMLFAGSTAAFLALSSRRLHDMGQTGMWTLLVFLPGVGAPLLFAALCVFPGDPEANRYGPNPRRPASVPKPTARAAHRRA